MGFCISWTEYESGWGCRPDGYHLYADAETAIADTASRLDAMRKREQDLYKGATPYEYSAPDNPKNPKMVQITPEIAKEIEEKGVAIRRMLPYESNGRPDKYYPLNYQETF